MILDKIAESTRIRVEKAKQGCSLEKLKAKIYDKAGIKYYNNRLDFAFEKALKKREGLSFICEVKKASPSKGIITEGFPYLDIAKEYEEAGAEAISVLTEPEFFKGNNIYLTKISDNVNIPVLRKDFIIDEYQIYEAKAMGADAILLICSLLDTELVKKFINLCDELGLSALTEAHTENELYSAIEAGARIIGVNNRNLQTFEVDINTSIHLRGLVPKDIIYVAESGIKTYEDIMALEAAGADAVLIGETLMRSPDKMEQLKILRGLR